ncbi:MAG: hypothetical protein HKN78_11700, partial [Sphingomonadaceae bacterium]|nr:hypothetical protein [Sphingomonadaceae bacterium]
MSEAEDDRHHSEPVADHRGGGDESFIGLGDRQFASAAGTTAMVGARAGRESPVREEKSGAKPAQRWDVLIIGGYGEVGRNIAARLRASHSDISIAIAGRDPAKAWNVASTLGGRTGGMALDTGDAAAVNQAVARSSLVIMNTEASTETVARACIRHGVPMISMAVDLSVLRRIAALGGLAEAKGIVLVRDVGLAPGMLQMLASQAVDRLPEADIVELFVELGVVGRHGQEAVDWTLTQIGKTPGQPLLMGPSGPARVLEIDFVDQQELAAKLGTLLVSSYLILKPQWSSSLLRHLAPFLQKHSQPLRKASALLASALSLAGLRVDRFRLTAVASSPTGQAKVSLSGRDQSQITGKLAAETAMRILAGRTAPGVIT